MNSPLSEGGTQRRVHSYFTQICSKSKSNLKEKNEKNQPVFFPAPVQRLRCLVGYPASPAGLDCYRDANPFRLDSDCTHHLSNVEQFAHRYFSNSAPIHPCGTFQHTCHASSGYPYAFSYPYSRSSDFNPFSIC